MLGLLPGLRLRGREHRQADRFQQARGRGDQRADDADREAGEPPLRLQRQLARDFRAIEAAQAGGDVGQQRGCDQIAADQTDQARDQRQRHQLEHQHRVEFARRDAAGAQRPQHRQALLERQPNRRIDDEQADEERQQAERGQIEMKAVGQAFEVALGIGGDQPQPVAGDGFKRRARAFGLAEQQARNLVRPVQELLRDADIDHQHARHHLRLLRAAAAASRRRWIRARRLPADRVRPSVSGATSVCPGGVMKDCRSVLSDRRAHCRPRSAA